MLSAVLLRVIAPGQTTSGDYIKLKRALISLNKEMDENQILSSEGSSERMKFNRDLTLMGGGSFVGSVVCLLVYSHLDYPALAFQNSATSSTLPSVLPSSVAAPMRRRR